MGGDLPKTLMTVGDIPVIRRTVQTLISTKLFRLIVVPVTPDLHREFQVALEGLSQVTLIDGGATRRESVLKGLGRINAALPEKASAAETSTPGSKSSEALVLVHDAARCLASPELIRRCIAAAWEHRAVTAAVPVVDSLVRVTEGSGACALSRQGVWAVQTPQVFDLALLNAAHARFDSTAGEATDDASLVEGLHQVRVVEGERENFKLTHPFDLRLAEVILASRAMANETA